MQRRGTIRNATAVDSAPSWSSTQWLDVVQINDSVNLATIGFTDESEAFDISILNFPNPGPLAAGWRWKYGSQGNTDGYSPATYPELTAADGLGISATYQLVYLMVGDLGSYSYPGLSRFTVQHTVATTPLLVYVQLASSTHPAGMRTLQLQRVEGNSVWTVASLTADSQEITTGQTSLVFRDVTTRATWAAGAPSANVCWTACALATVAPAAESIKPAVTASESTQQQSSPSFPFPVTAASCCHCSRMPPSPSWQAEANPGSTSGVDMFTNSSDVLFQQHWGVSFLGRLPQFSLVDSVVEDVPLSPAAPLVDCRDCDDVVLRNVTLRRLAPLAAGSASASTAGSAGPYIFHAIGNDYGADV
ncbi:hypothetical protein HXX76_002866 [Chlamydomonas incerta]|uniref:Uncharacterized protein n=1 Tax=Chlamydomonas incerta TaxID=51695 RepID=A0A835TEU4_CHLIN|nr:hypothetical protein HXX76_002866 [Chlamydomonas incerta]|eukprot:KAG2442786.1 hypothetical protein HXX76_002866 [Chlamydomonas incerta]